MANSLHNPPPLLLNLLHLVAAHHLPIFAHSGLLHSLEGLVKPPTHETRLVPGHFGVAGTALAVVFAAALGGGEVAEELALGGGGGLWVGWVVSL